MRGGQNILTKTFGNLYGILKKSFKPCPVFGKHMVENIPFDSSVIPSTLLATGDYRWDGRQFNGQNETIFYVQLFITIKNPFF
jgi:hypothetical protein